MRFLYDCFVIIVCKKYKHIMACMDNIESVMFSERIVAERERDERRFLILTSCGRELKCEHVKLLTGTFSANPGRVMCPDDLSVDIVIQ